MDAYSTGFHDAARGHTACPFGTPEEAQQWAEGYDANADAKLPRFGALTKKKRK
jgi:ribosome modulation factor